MSKNYSNTTAETQEINRLVLDKRILLNAVHILVPARGSKKVEKILYEEMDKIDDRLVELGYFDDGGAGS